MGGEGDRTQAARSVAMLVNSEEAFAAPSLKQSLTDRVASVRLWSAIALWRIDPDPGAIPILTAGLKSALAEGGTFHAVIRVLREAGTLAKPAVPEIRKVILQFDPERLLPEGGACLIPEARDALRPIDPTIDPIDMVVP